MDRIDTYEIIARWFDHGWKSETFPVTGSLDAVYRAASSRAKALDEDTGGDRYWTVDVYGEVDGKRLGFLQLFHGRLS